MVRHALLIAVLAPLSGFAQLQVYEFDGTNDTPLSSLTTIGPIAPGATTETRFHIRNMGSGPVPLNTLTLWGAGFTIASQPSLPYVIAPYVGPPSQVEFDINFSPEITGSFGAFLGVNSLNFALQGLSELAASVTISGSQTPLSPGATVNFGAVTVGSSHAQDFVLTNASRTSLTVDSVTLSGAGFSGPIGLTPPAQLSPGQTASFQVIFTPQSATAYQGTLTIDGQTFPLSGQGLIAPPQLELFQFACNGGADTPVPTGVPFNVGIAAPGDTIATCFHIRNMADAAVVLTPPSLSGSGFSIQSSSQFPYTLPPYVGPSSEAEIQIAFSPTTVGPYSATLAVGTLSLTLQGAATVSAAVTVQGSTTALTTGAPLDFGQVDIGSSLAKKLVLSNPSSAAITVNNVTVSGACFSLLPGLTLPLQLAPSQTVSFQVSFSPQTGTSYQGTLSVDGRTFNLRGVGVAPALPGASIVFGPGTVASGQTNNLSILLSEASQTKGAGTLQISFQPGVPGATPSSDPAIQFFPLQAREESVTIAPGDTTAMIDGQPNIQFQTGTTAGTITFTLTLEGEPPQQTTLTIPPAAVTLDEVNAVRLPGQINILVQGFDNTYSASELAFTFYDLNSNALPQGAISVDASGDFEPYFATTQYGGMFQLLLQFPVNGNTAEIGYVSVGVTNSVGTTTTTQPVAITN